MCDYSLHSVASRPAKVGDKLITTDFSNTLTRGFSAIGEPDVAVCLMPGTELAFEENVERHYVFLQTLFFSRERWKIRHKVGVFRQINMDNPGTHHDAIEFPNGQIVLVTRLRASQRATVLQLPARAHAAADGNTQELAPAPVHVR